MLIDVCLLLYFLHYLIVVSSYTYILEVQNTQIFGFFHEKMHKRVNGLTFKYLRKGGKQLLIKSVATAMPNHVMSCFRWPKTITSKLTSIIISQCWWSYKGNGRGMHLIAWNKLCFSKEEGVIGFKTLVDFNT